MAGDQSKANKLLKLPLTLEAYLSGLTEAERAGIEDLFQSALIESQQLDLVDLWERRENAATFWVLLISGVNQPEEMEIARELLTWKAFFPKDSAMVLCIQSSDHAEFQCTSARFGIVNCPSLVFSNSPEMASFVEIKSELLFTLLSTKGAFQRFLTRVHQSIVNGEEFENIRTALWSEQFWSGIKVIYAEVKGIVGASVKANLDFK